MVPSPKRSRAGEKIGRAERAVAVIRPTGNPGGHREPEHLYLRHAVLPFPADQDRSAAALRRVWLRELERVGRLVAEGPSDESGGHLLLFRAANRAEAERVLRSDPFVVADGPPRELWAWSTDRVVPGVNLAPAPARGAGRLTELHRISVFVRDQAAAAQWYREVLGLSVRSSDPETELLELSLGPGAAGLALVRPRPEWGPPHFAEANARVGQGTGISFRTDSVEALALRLDHAGARITQSPRVDPWGGRSIRFSDPDGNEFLAFDEGTTRAETVPRPARRRHRRRSAGAEPGPL